jgi:hypothetical protein
MPSSRVTSCTSICTRPAAALRPDERIVCHKSRPVNIQQNKINYSGRSGQHALLVFKSDSTASHYRNDMKVVNSEKWVTRTLIPNLLPHYAEKSITKLFRIILQLQIYRPYAIRGGDSETGFSYQNSGFPLSVNSSKLNTHSFAYCRRYIPFARDSVLK